MAPLCESIHMSFRVFCIHALVRKQAIHHAFVCWLV